MKTTKVSDKPLMPGRDLAFHLARLEKFGGGTHQDRRTKRNRDRGAQRRQAIKEQNE